MKIQTKRLYKVMTISMFFVGFFIKDIDECKSKPCINGGKCKIFPEAVAVIADLDLWDIIVKKTGNDIDIRFVCLARNPVYCCNYLIHN